MAIQTFVADTILTAAQMNALQGNDYNQTVSTKTASYTLVAADKGTKIVMNSASATTITVNTSLFSAGDNLTILNISSGVCTVTAGTATVSTTGSLALAQNGGGTLYFTSAGVSVFQANGVTAAAPTSRVWLHTFSGYGSSSTAIPRFTTTVVNSGSDITYADSASLGSTFTINTAGMYAMTLTMESALSNACFVGFSLNGTQLSTGILGITAATRLALAGSPGVASTTGLPSVSVTFYAAVNDVIRPQTDATTPVNVGRCQLTIVRVN